MPDYRKRRAQLRFRPVVRKDKFVYKVWVGARKDLNLH